MALTILDNDEAFHSNQALWMQTDINALVAGIGGDGVVSGCAVTAQGTPDMTCAVASGSVRIAGAIAAVTSGNVTITTADATNPRIDLVVVSNAGVKSVTAGTAAALPKAPDIPASSILLAMVYVPAADTAIQGNQITDKRAIVTAAMLDAANTFSTLQTISTASGTAALRLISSGVSGRTLYATHTISSSAGVSPPFYPFLFETTITETDYATPLNIISAGLSSAVAYGPAAQAVVGTAHAGTLSMAIGGSASASNEHAALYAAIRYDIGTGYTQTAGPAGRAWLTDFNVHGPIAVQPNKLDGITMFINNYYNGSPADSASAALWLVSKAGSGGGSDATHAAATTYAVDIGLGIVGAASGTGRGFAKAISIGGTGSGWTATSRFGTGVDIADWELFGLRVSGRFAAATGPAIAVDAGVGPVLIGATAAMFTTTLLEVQGVGSTDPLVAIGSTSQNSDYGVRIRNASGTGIWFIAGAANGLLTGTAAGDTGIKVLTAAKAFHIGGTTSTLAVGQANTLGFFNTTPIAQPSSTTDLRTALINLGLYATGGASPLNLNGGALTAGSLNTHTIPGGTDTIVLLAATQTLTNKTLTTPILSGNTTLAGQLAITYLAAAGLVVNGVAAQYTRDSADSNGFQVTWLKTRSGGAITANDIVGDFLFDYLDSAVAEVSGVIIRVVAPNVTSGATSGEMRILTRNAGAITTRYVFKPNGMFAVGNGANASAAGHFIAPDASTIGVIAQGAASASANLFEARTSAGTPVASIGPAGIVALAANAYLSQTGIAGNPASPVAGDHWYNTTQKSHRMQLTAGTAGLVGLLKAQTSIAGGDTINTTASETNFATNFAIPANALTVGKVLRVYASGVYGTLGSGTVTLQLKLKMGTTVLLDSTAITTAISIAARFWKVEGILTVISVGASGTLECRGEFRIPTANTDTGYSEPAVGGDATVTVDTTASQTLQISAQHGASSASNTIKMRAFTVEVLD